DRMKVSLYGDNTLTIKGGRVEKQHYNIYGDSEVDVQAMEGYIAIANMFGDNELQLHAKDELRVFGFGDFEILYRGNPLIRKSISLGDYDIARID
ncbi:MAG: hypothetical protein AAFO94_11815, partial [Bacteroidota bacterium]